MTSKTLIIGASGGIGNALVSRFADNGDEVIAVSRSGYVNNSWPDTVTVKSIAEHNEASISAFVEDLKSQNIKLNNVVVTTGVLKDDEIGVNPEKRLEDMSESSLASYFAVNSIIPALWLKYLVNVMDKNHATVVCLSARVGSISDNGFGGWYGYRASKAALNMLVKTASIEYKRRVKNAMLVCYHPGTVDTELSKPFQKNVAEKKLFTPAFTADQLFTHISKLDRDQPCHFIDWDGEVVTW